jgi:kumamolisin
MSLESIQIDLPDSLNKEQIEVLPSYTSITQPPLLTAPQIATAYNIPPSNGVGVKIGIVSLGGGFSQADLNMSMANLGLTTGNVTFVPVDAAANNYNPVYSNSASYKGTVENTLDLVCVAGMVPSANIVLYIGQNVGPQYWNNAQYAANVNSNSSFGNAIQAAVNDNCDVISISWGVPETIISGNVTYYCGDYLAAALANATAKNICVFVASGDYGSTAIPDASIGVNVDYPSASNNVTAVGGTNLTLTVGNTRSGSETLYNNGSVGGSGGVSLVTPLPSWQANLTYKTYPGNVVTSLITRGVPDISAPFGPYGIWLNGNISSVVGTSASAPIMAGMVARFISLNSVRRPPGGSAGLNSIFYNHTSGFYDITTGNNVVITSPGYTSTVGWDATTGLGPQLNAIATYQSVTSAGVAIKNSGNTWAPVANVYVKTGASTWANVQHIWTKTAANTWAQTY